MRRLVQCCTLTILALTLCVDRLHATLTTSITSPGSYQLSNVYQSQGGSASVTVTGSVGGTTLNNWTLQYKPAAAPAWTPIATGTAPITNGTLGVWQTLALPNGAYNLQLKACEAGGLCTTTTVNPTIANFTLTQSTYEFTNGQTITYSATLPWSLTITLTIKKPNGDPVKAVGTTTSGLYTYQWNGTNTGGLRVPDGPYFVSARVDDADGNGMTWDQTGEYLSTIPSYTYVTQPDYDPFNNDPLDITYNLGVGRVTIAVAPPGITEIQSTCPPPSGFCILNQKYEESGSHTLRWAGVDSAGVFRPDVGSIAIVSERTAFSKNAVVLFGTKPTVDNVVVTPPVVWSGASQVVTFDVAGPTAIASGKVEFLNQESSTVLRTLTTWSCIGTHCAVTWDGKANNGVLVAPGAYTITVTATDTIGNIVSAQALAFIQY